MRKIVGGKSLSCQICLSLLAISVLSVIQLVTTDKTCFAQTHTVTVNVEDSGAMSPIEGAVVKLKNAETTVGVTDASGQVVFTDVPEGIYDIIADAQCYHKKKKLDKNIETSEKHLFF